MMISLSELKNCMALGTMEQEFSSNYISYVPIGIWCFVHTYCLYTRVRLMLLCRSTTREKDVEQTLVKETKKKGGMALKLTSPSSSGLPDRLLLLPKGRVVFVELKAPGKKTRKLQDVVIAKLRELGFRVEVVDTKEKAKEVLSDL